MEAPNILGDLNRDKPNDSIELNLVSDKNILYDISIFILSDKICFNAESKYNFPQKKYKNEYTLEQIKENIFFYLHENIKEIYDELDSIIKNLKEKNELNILEETNKIIIRVPLPSIKIKECLFEMNEIPISTQQQFAEVFIKLNEIQKENSEIKNESKEIKQINNELKDQNNELKKKINEINQQNNKLQEQIIVLDDKNNELKKQNNELKIQNDGLKKKIDEVIQLSNELKNQTLEIKNDIIKELKDYNKKTMQKAYNNIDHINEIITIIEQEKRKMKSQKEEQRENDLKLIAKWIDSSLKINFQLIYRKSTHGDTPNDFHWYCDNKGKTVTIIETKDGMRFGGFKNDSWDTKGWKKNTKDFVFSLNRKVKYSHCGEGDSTFGNIDYGPNFGNSSPGEISFYKSLNIGRNINDKYNTNGELNMKKDYFEAVEVDVYKVTF